MEDDPTVPRSTVSITATGQPRVLSLMMVRFHLPGTHGFTTDWEMAQVPGRGDTIVLPDGDEDDYLIHHVVWTPTDANHDAYVVLKTDQVTGRRVEPE